jgi:hypothetical protein
LRADLARTIAYHRASLVAIPDARQKLVLSRLSGRDGAVTAFASIPQLRWLNIITACIAAERLDEHYACDKEQIIREEAAAGRAQAVVTALGNVPRGSEVEAFVHGMRDAVRFHAGMARSLRRLAPRTATAASMRSRQVGWIKRAVHLSCGRPNMAAK